MRAADTPPDAPLLLTVEQVALALAVSPRTVENLIARGELVSLRIGRCRRVPKAAIDAYVARLMDEQLEQPLPAAQVRLLHRTKTASARSLAEAEQEVHLNRARPAATG